MDRRLSEIEDLWRSTLEEYRQDGLRDRLVQRWPNDRNVTARVSYGYPPTFQPGCVGPQYFSSSRRVVILAQNPGEGSDHDSQIRDCVYLRKLNGFRRCLVSFEELNVFICNEIISWPVYRDKGIFQESGETRAALLGPRNRISIAEIGYVNAFPFKLPSRKPPLKTGFRAHVWQEHVSRLLQLLAPRIVVRFPESDSAEPLLRALLVDAVVQRVWHPSDYNTNARPGALAESWEPLDRLLGYGTAEPAPVGGVGAEQNAVAREEREVGFHG